MTAALVAAVLTYGYVTAPPRRVSFAAPADSAVMFGAYHVHSTRSDGTWTPERIAGAARRAGLSFVILTDHGDATRTVDPPRYVDGVLLVDAVELSVAEGHIVALGLGQAAPYRLAGSARDVIEDIHRLGGFAIVAHPDSPRPDLRWRPLNTGARGAPGAADLAGADGLEWLNADSEWRDERWPRLLQAALTTAIRPGESLTALFSMPHATLGRWYAASRSRQTIGLGAIDAHGVGGRLYDASLSSLAQAVRLSRPPTQDAAVDAALLLDGLRAGHTWSVVTGFGSIADVTMTASIGGQSAGIGDRLPAGDGQLALDAVVPAAPTARLVLTDGDREVATGFGDIHYTVRGQPATYRLEVWLHGFDRLPWIITNPIYVQGPPPAVPAPAAARDQIVAGLDQDGGWTVEHSPASTGAVSVDGDAMKFTYSLGTAAPLLEYAAMARSMGEGLESFDRLEFIAESSRPARFWVQFRLPGGRDGERWARSVYADGTPRAMTIKLADVVPMGFTTSRRPVVARVKTILFVVDTVNTAPGAAGWLRISHPRMVRSGSGANAEQPVGGSGQEQQVRRPGRQDRR